MLASCTGFRVSVASTPHSCIHRAWLTWTGYWFEPASCNGDNEGAISCGWCCRTRPIDQSQQASDQTSMAQDVSVEWAIFHAMGHTSAAMDAWQLPLLFSTYGIEYPTSDPSCIACRYPSKRQIVVRRRWLRFMQRTVLS